MLHRQDQALSQSLLTLREAVKELLGIPEFRQRTHLAALTMSTEPSTKPVYVAPALRYPRGKAFLSMVLLIVNIDKLTLMVVIVYLQPIA